MHLILFRSTPWEEMHVSRHIPLHLKCARLERPLFAMQNMEIIIRRVQTGMPLRTEGSPKYDQVFRDRGVYNVHGTHGTSCVIECPFGGVGVERNDARRGWVCVGKVRDNVLDDAVEVVWMGSDGILGELMKKGWVEDIPPALDRVQPTPDEV